jgi:hypothetical protein
VVRAWLNREVHRYLDIRRQREGRPIDRDRRNPQARHRLAILADDDRLRREVQLEARNIGRRRPSSVTGS